MKTKKSNNHPKVLSLFSGCGGLDIGFHNAGFDIVGCVEIESQFCQTLNANIGEGKFFGNSTEVICQDIRKFDVSKYVDCGIECVIGGPPCQPFSAAGRRAGGVPGIQDDRGTLFESYCDVLEALRPRVFVFENVYGLKGANDGTAWNEIKRSFSAIGYTIKAEILDAADYGVPQHRERLILVGTLDADFTFPKPSHGPDSGTDVPFVTILDAIQDIQNENNGEEEIGGLYGKLLPLVPEGLNYSFFTKEMGYPEPLFAWRSKFHDFLYKADRNRPSRTLKAQPGKYTGPFHWNNRHFTIAELKRIQTIPDNYILTGSETKQTAQIGNSVPPVLAEALAYSVLDQILRPVPVEQYHFQLREDDFVSTFRTRQRAITEYYKEVARLEIARRFGDRNLINEEINYSFSKSYFIGYNSLFKSEILKKKPAKITQKDYIAGFSVSSKCKNEKLNIVLRNGYDSPKSYSVNINISGLKKYLSKIDKLTLKATLNNVSEIFQVWDIIEKELVGMSQFYSLIDIYGHYANRGDTVSIETQFTIKENEPLEPLVRALAFYGNSDNCGIYFTRKQVCEAIEIEESELDGMLKLLRGLRFDARTSSTHATIRTKEVLCTYPFPMLSERVMFTK